MKLNTKQLILLVAMVATGTINTISANFQNAKVALGKDGELRYFEHPYMQAMFMMLGECLCMLVYLIIRFINRNTPEKNKSDELPYNTLILWPASFMDLVATSMGYMGLAMIHDAGVFQMLRVTAMIWCGLLSIPFLGHRLKWFQWVGMFTIAGGLIAKASEQLLPDYEEKDYCGPLLLSNWTNATTSTPTITGNPASGHNSYADDNDGTSDIVIGYLIIIFGEFLHGAQFVYEEKYVVKYNIPPLKTVGWEGIFGFLTMAVLLWGFYFIEVGENMGYGPEFRFEDAIDGFHMIFSGKPNLWLLGWTLGNMCSIACFNYTGIAVMKELTATTRSVLDNLRIIFIWAFFLIDFGDYLCSVYTEFHYLHVVGLSILLIGIWLYNDIIIMPFIRKYVLRSKKESSPEGIAHGVDETDITKEEKD